MPISCGLIKHIPSILDSELSGLGNKEFDIAWAMILRPGQRFMNGDEESSLFMDGCQLKVWCNRDYVKYYMLLIYLYFYKIGKTYLKYSLMSKKSYFDYCKK